MALIVSAGANLEGKLMRPKIEFDRPPEMFSQVLTREHAAEVRRIMNMVTEAGGTANSAMAPVKAAGIRSGGKTGTAQKAVPVIDPKTGEPQRRTVYERDFKGKIIRQYEEIVMHEKLRSDAWYLSFAPLDKPVIAMAVLLEGPGPGISFYGGKNAGPIAAQLILKANALGYFGGAGKQTTQPPPTPRKRNR
jgi:penicillin-binding protein 2